MKPRYHNRTTISRWTDLRNIRCQEVWLALRVVRGVSCERLACKLDLYWRLSRNHLSNMNFTSNGHGCNFVYLCGKGKLMRIRRSRKELFGSGSHAHNYCLAHGIFFYFPFKNFSILNHTRQGASLIALLDSKFWFS